MPAVDQRRSGQHRGQLLGHRGLGTQATGDPALAVSLLVFYFLPEQLAVKFFCQNNSHEFLVTVYFWPRYATAVCHLFDLQR